MSNPWGSAISLAAARTIVVRALAHARSSDFPPMTVAVLDAAGQAGGLRPRRRIEPAA